MIISFTRTIKIFSCKNDQPLLINYILSFGILVFQFVYYTVFGAYSALLFIHTGNIIGPIVAHTFCNYMGLPEFQVLFQLPEPRRSGLFVMSFMGLILWLVVIKFVSHPWIYSNQMDWTEMNQCYTTAN